MNYICIYAIITATTTIIYIGIECMQQQEQAQAPRPRQRRLSGITATILIVIVAIIVIVFYIAGNNGPLPTVWGINSTGWANTILGVGTLHPVHIYWLTSRMRLLSDEIYLDVCYNHCGG